MTLWIIIGSLVGVVAIFLVVMSIKDRKKTKLREAELKEVNQKKSVANAQTIVFLNELINKNEKILKDFVPSVGKYKMGDIREKAKKALNDFQKGTIYKFASDLEDNKKTMEIFDQFKTTNSNTWSKKLANEIKELEEVQKEMQKDFIKEAKEETKEYFEGVY